MEIGPDLRQKWRKVLRPAIIRLAKEELIEVVEHPSGEQVYLPLPATGHRRRRHRPRVTRRRDPAATNCRENRADQRSNRTDDALAQADGQPRPRQDHPRPGGEPRDRWRLRRGPGTAARRTSSVRFGRFGSDGIAADRRARRRRSESAVSHRFCSGPCSRTSVDTGRNQRPRPRPHPAAIR